MDDEQPPEPTVERVERPDGRYVIYFSWPDDPPSGEPSSDTQSAVDE